LRGLRERLARTAGRLQELSGSLLPLRPVTLLPHATRKRTQHPKKTLMRQVRFSSEPDKKRRSSCEAGPTAARAIIDPVKPPNRAALLDECNADLGTEETMVISRRGFNLSLAAGAAASMLPQLAGAQQGKKVALLFDSLVSPFWVTGLDIMRAECKKRGWTALEAISNFDDNKQFEQVKAMIAQKVDAILIIQTDSKAVIPAIRAANAANIPMVHFNRPPAASDAYSVAIQADNRKIMAGTVQFMVDQAKKAGGKYKACLLVGDLGDVNAIQRRDGFFDTVNQHKDIIDVVSRVATEWNADKAFAGLTNAIQANPDINFLVTSSDFMHPQIEQVLKTAGKWHKSGEEGHVIFGGFDGDEGAYARLKDGYLDACGVQNLFLEVDMAFKAFEDLWAGKKPEKLLLDPGFVITQANLKEKQDQMWGYSVWKKQNP
jgi:ABC-type sugar transport system substrate-binding protein